MQSQDVLAFSSTTKMNTHPDNSILIRKNNQKDIQLILNTLARHQTHYLVAIKDIAKTTRWNFSTILKSVTIPNSHLENTIKEIDELHEEGILVPSMTSDFHKALLLDKTSVNAVMFNQTSGQVVSPIFDALMCIFTTTDEKFRQIYFEDLVKYYFEKLRICLNEVGSDLTSIFTETYTDRLVRLFLPVVKITINKFPQKQTPEDLLSSIENYFKTPELNQEDIYVILKNMLGSDNYQLLAYNLRRLGESNGHVGQYYHLDINFKTIEQTRKVTLFTKFLIPPTESMEFFVRNKMSPREHFFYSTIIPLFRRNNLDAILDFGPKCYLSRVGWVMVFDDLTSEGFVASTPNNTLDYTALSCVVSKLAKFHACTIVCEEIMSKRFGQVVSLYDKYNGKLDDISFHESNPLVDIFKHSLDKLKYLIKLCPDLTEARHLSADDISRGIDNMHGSIHTKLAKNKKYRNSICHGDLYLGNILVKEDKTSAMLVDFQLIRYCPPTTDLAFLLYNISTKETRDMYLHKLIDVYYNNVTQILDQFGVNSETIFPKNDFMDSFKFAQSFGIIMALLYNHITHQEPHFREQLFQDPDKHKYYLYDNCEELVNIGWRNEKYRKILRGLVEDSVELIANKNF